MRRAAPQNIHPAVARAFAPQPQSAPAEPSRPTAIKNGLELLWHAKLGESLSYAVKMPGAPLLAAATGEGAVVFVSSEDGKVAARCDDLCDAPPNVMLFASAWLVHCSDDSMVRIVASDTAKVVHTHVVAEPAEAGKRSRCVAIDHAVILDGAAFVAAAGTLVHACSVPGGELVHTLHAPSPVRAMCVAPEGQSSEWAYAIAYKGGVQLVAKDGVVLRELRTQRVLNSLDAFGPWIAAAAYDGIIELWDLVTPRHSEAPNAHILLRATCGINGSSLAWRPDGGALAAGGARAAVFDFTGAAPAHPYRRQHAPPAGQPDPVPRVCMADGGHIVEWAPPGDSHRADGTPMSEFASLNTQEGQVRLWQPHGTPLKKGGSGNPSQPQLMKPQFYTFTKQDAVHPSGEAVEACSLMWLSQSAVAVGYFTGEIVAWRVAGADDAIAIV